MSTDEKEKQDRSFKKLENYGIRTTVLQVITILCAFGAFSSWYLNRDEKNTIDGATLNNKIDNVLVYFKNSHTKDSIIYKQQRFIDSVSLANKFINLKSDINKNIDQKLISTDARLNTLEIKYRNGWMTEHKKTPNSIPTAQNVRQ